MSVLGWLSPIDMQLVLMTEMTEPIWQGSGYALRPARWAILPAQFFSFVGLTSLTNVQFPFLNKYVTKTII